MPHDRAERMRCPRCLQSMGNSCGSDQAIGITRHKAGKGWSYRGPAGRITDLAQRARLAALAIPPAYTEVWINPDPHADLQATGRDEAGRKQYIYHPDWLEARAAAKFDTLGVFGRALPTLRAPG